MSGTQFLRSTGVAAIAGLICECCMSFRHARQLEPRGSVHNRLDVQRPLG
jgi:hypothetical protein